jgi:lysylphosphatidylglycerol synthetase-like protein (DUF2156 family)
MSLADGGFPSAARRPIFIPSGWARRSVSALASARHSIARASVAAEEIGRARLAIEAAEFPRPEAWASLLGDKKLVFSPSGASFLAIGVAGKDWIALGAPVGRREERSALIRQAQTQARAANARLSFYGVGPEFAADAADAGLILRKTGERALVDLASFSLDGKSRQVLRTHRNRHIKLGAHVTVEPSGAAGPLFETLRPISDDWLARHGGLEKGFGLGRFERAYLDQLPLALVRLEDRIVAFASLWPTADKSRICVDLMRFVDDAPKGVMDYLFAELMLWAKADGYKTFDLNTAPLSGVTFDPAAPIATAAARFIYERGEAIYNFQGVRRFKAKFDPDWEDVFLALKPGVSLVSVMGRAASLTTGGLRRVMAKRLAAGAA